ncbi:hypothetical protein [Roseomonas populi]|uniref:Uncharacterized protein n=1 Tax=Roseomonas populi TaxID=3121582 RepID=A0ABT1WZR2_9PROT|nr:hypothetical protein [Roseomonas pecuniae]MCR0980613.1 hypothetical protein [Roseomonas pecuniae]
MTPLGPCPTPQKRSVNPAPLIAAVKDLVQHARSKDLPLADEVLTDVLAKLCGWPVEELNRLR